jgi:hypothetical protein
MRALFLATTVLCTVVGLLFGSGNARSADLSTNAPVVDAVAPAVDGINGKIDGFGGSIAKRSVYGGEGSLSMPLGSSYGLQVDGAGGSLGGSEFASTAGHLFWRDPSIGLIGAYASYSHWDAFSGVNLAKYGAEGAWYAGRWTLEGVAGVESGSNKTDFSNGMTTTINLVTRGFDHVTASYYVNDNWKLSLGQLYTGGRNALTVGTEYGFGLGGSTMAALFAEGFVSDAGRSGFLGGLKFYFGQHEKSLIRRNREDDPTTTTTDGLQGLANGATSMPTGTGSGGGGGGGGGGTICPPHC